MTPKLYNVTAMLKFAPDAGKPHPMRDGTYDRVMHEVNRKLNEEPPR